MENDHIDEELGDVPISPRVIFGGVGDEREVGEGDEELVDRHLSLHDGFVSEHRIVATPLDVDQRTPKTTAERLLGEIRSDIRGTIFRRSASSPFMESSFRRLGGSGVGGSGGVGGGGGDVAEDRRGAGIAPEVDEDQNKMWRLQARRGRIDDGRIRVSMIFVLDLLILALGSNNDGIEISAFFPFTRNRGG